MRNWRGKIAEVGYGKNNIGRLAWWISAVISADNWRRLTTYIAQRDFVKKRINEISENHKLSIFILCDKSGSLYNTIKNEENVINLLSVYKYFNINREMNFFIRQLYLRFY